MTYELAWKVMKKKLLEDGVQTLGAKDVFMKAFQLNYIDDEDIWLQMIDDRNNAAQVYDEGSAKKIVDRIKASYFDKIKATFDFTP